jgi:predicted nucleotidyltransferase component of viral defense system
VFDTVYEAQAHLMLRCLPEVAKQPCFAVKGGTALNFFVRAMPRLSVDIDLTYIRLSQRQAALSEIDVAMRGIAQDVEHHIRDAHVEMRSIEGTVSRLAVRVGDTHIKIEPNLVLRGSLYPPVQREMCDSARELFQMFAAVPCLSVPDLYAGKICAALDRQHPRDFFDVMLLLENEGLTNDIRRAFVVYLASTSRPMHELLAPKAKDLKEVFDQQFSGMERIGTSVDQLREVQDLLPRLIRNVLIDEEKRFLLSMKKGKPEWDLLGIDHLPSLPALQWKLINIRRMTPPRRQDALSRLMSVLSS